MSLNTSLLEPETMSGSIRSLEEELKKKLRNDARSGKWEEVYETYKHERGLRRADITGTGDTVLHMAVSSGEEKVVKKMIQLLVDEENGQVQRGRGKKQVVEYMVDLLERDIVPRDVEEGRRKVDAIHILRAENDHKNTPLHLAAIIGNVEMCIKICDRDPSLITRRNDAGETPLFLAAVYGMKEAFIKLHDRYMQRHGVSSTDFTHYISDNNDTILHCAIAEGHFDVAIEVVHRYKHHMKEMMRRNKDGLTPLHLLAAQPSAFKSWGLELPSFLRPIDGRLSQLPKRKEAHTWSLHIMNELLQYAPDEDISQIISKKVSAYENEITIETPLLIAAKNGVIEMVEKILELFPRRIKDLNDEEKNILLLAVEYRQTKVITFLCKQKWLSESLFWQEDKDGNNVLHLAARLGDEPDIFSLWDALFMSREIKFFEFVKNLAPRSLLERYNKKMETPNDILRKSHKELMKAEGDWASKTSNACFLVSTLLATMAFSHVTNNFDENNYSSLVAFSSSLIATISFLAILAFPHQSLNFWKYVPFMLCFAILSMLTSMLCLWISFMLHARSLTPYIIFGSPIAFPTIILLLVLIGPPLMSKFTAPNRNTTSAICYRRTDNLIPRN